MVFFREYKKEWQQLSEIPIDNKAEKNYFGHFSEQLRTKGGSAFKAISDRLVLKSSADIAFAEGAEFMLKDKSLKKRKQEVDKIEAEWSKVAMTDSKMDKLAREQSKNKALIQCKENGERLKYPAPVSSQEDVNKMFVKIQKLTEKDQVTIMRKEIQFKKLLFSDMPHDFILFKQYNISAKQMFQNLLALHSVDASNQEIISVEDIYAITDSLQLLSLPKPKKRAPGGAGAAIPSEFHWPPQDEEFVIFLQEDGWSLGSVSAYDDKTDSITIQCLMSLKTRAKDDQGKTYLAYPEEEAEQLQRKHVLEIRPSVSVAKNVMRKDLVFALLNREVFEAKVLILDSFAIVSILHFYNCLFVILQFFLMSI